MCNKSYFINENRLEELNNDLKGAKVVKIEILNSQCMQISFSDNKKLDIYSDDDVSGIEYSEKF